MPAEVAVEARRTSAGAAAVVPECLPSCWHVRRRPVAVAAVAADRIQGMWAAEAWVQLELPIARRQSHSPACILRSHRRNRIRLHIHHRIPSGIRIRTMGVC